MTILLLGATGTVGSALAHRLSASFPILTPSRREIDLADPSRLYKKLSSYSFDLLINAAAMANVDECERNPSLAYTLNAHAPHILAHYCRSHNIRFLHFSTDYVLQGTQKGLKTECAPTFPNGVYGHTKLLGERAILERNSQALIARISWVFGNHLTPHSGGFFQKILSQLIHPKERLSLEGVADKFSTPTYIWDLVDWVMTLCEDENAKGIWHLTHPPTQNPSPHLNHSLVGESWWSYAQQVVRLAHQAGLITEPYSVKKRYQECEQIFPIKRPQHTALYPERLITQTTISLRTWQEAGSHYIQTLI